MRVFPFEMWQCEPARQHLPELVEEMAALVLERVDAKTKKDLILRFSVEEYVDDEG